MPNCIVVDDESATIVNLSQYIDRLPGFKLVKSFTDPIVALNYIGTHEPVDVLFLDIEMPKISGIELAESVRHKCKYLIFTTSYTKYALDAFKVFADAYLLKPYSENDFDRTLRRLFPYLEENLLSENIFAMGYFYIQSLGSNQYNRIELGKLVAIQKSGPEMYISTMTTRLVVESQVFEQIKSILERRSDFIVINKDTVISKIQIASVSKFSISMSNNLIFMVSGKFKLEFAKFLKEHRLKPRITELKRIGIN